MKAYKGHYDEEYGFDDSATEILEPLAQRFKADPDYWLSVVNQVGVDSALDMINLKKAEAPKQDRVDKILKKSELISSPKTDSSQVSDYVDLTKARSGIDRAKLAAEAAFSKLIK